MASDAGVGVLQNFGVWSIGGIASKRRQIGSIACGFNVALAIGILPGAFEHVAINTSVKGAILRREAETITYEFHVVQCVCSTGVQSATDFLELLVQLQSALSLATCPLPFATNVSSSRYQDRLRGNFVLLCATPMAVLRNGGDEIFRNIVYIDLIADSHSVLDFVHHRFRLR